MGALGDAHFRRRRPTVARVEDLSARFRDFSRAFRTSAPLYSRLADRVSREPDILDLMNSADAVQRIPVLLFACVHYLLLNDPGQALARHFPNLDRSASTVNVDDVAADDFARFVLRHRDDLADLLATRSTQTNEIGRCNWFLFPLAMIEEEVGDLARVDVGSSAGLTLLFPDIEFDVRPGNRIGDQGGLTLQCLTRGHPPRLDHVPNVVWSRGLDTRPVDLFDEDHVRWLEACVWPEQLDRFDRLVRSVELARQRGIRVEHGDAVEDTTTFVRRANRHGHPVVTTSWVLNYLTSAQRVDFVARLDAIGSEMDLSWVVAESPRETPELPVFSDSDEDITVISLVRWRAGRRESVRLATAHPHGAWINWEL